MENKYWLSLEDYNNSPSFKEMVKNEFLSELPTKKEMSQTLL